MMMFVLKKLVSRFFFPLSLVIELLLLGIFLKKEVIAKLFKIWSPLPSLEGVRGWVKL
ncbi:MAG: hypothetical protein KKH02_05845 [Proteobacteria bacterium]|nr:hypothetical protein [Pseudomonadota bacterium]MCG2739000.1 hypothetical protein [Syntrophaceae bacterium]